MIAMNGKYGVIQGDGSGTKITALGLREMLDKQAFKCAMSGRELTPQTASIDHIVPVARGGLNVMENVHVVHSEVNQAKRAMPIEDFVSMCQEIVTHYRGNQ